MYQPPQLHGWVGSYLTQINQQEIATLKLWFDSVDQDKGGTIEPHELAGLNFDGIPLGLETAIKYVKVFDKDGNGRIDFWEYCALHKMILTVRNAFFMADKDRSGTLQANEIHTAFVSVGFNYLGFNTIVELLKKYDPHNYGINLQTFLLIAAQIAHVRSIFEWNDVGKIGLVKMNLDQFNQVISHLS